MGQVIARNTDAIVAHPHAVGVGGFFAADFDAQTWMRILLERVFDEVEENLGPVKAVAVNERAFGRQQVLHIGALVADHRFEAF